MAEQIGEVANKGLTAAQLARLPTKVFKGSSRENEEDCLICMANYEEGDQLRILTCFHQFHSSCIDKWLNVCVEKQCNNVWMLQLCLLILTIIFYMTREYLS